MYIHMYASLLRHQPTYARANSWNFSIAVISAGACSITFSKKKRAYSAYSPMNSLAVIRRVLSVLRYFVIGEPWYLMDMQLFHPMSYDSKEAMLHIISMFFVSTPYIRSTHASTFLRAAHEDSKGFYSVVSCVCTYYIHAPRAVPCSGWPRRRHHHLVHNIHTTYKWRNNFDHLRPSASQLYARNGDSRS